VVIEMSWFEQHINWSMLLGWLAVGIIEFVLLFFTASESGETLFFIYGALVTLSLLIGACGLRIKGRSMAWMLLCFVPFGLVAILVLKNRNAIKDE
jgi:purine-cytosine permease-like protein